MTILSSAMAVSAIKKMQSFHEEMVQLYSSFDIDLLENSGRRNIVMSSTQERFFADEIKKIFPQTIVDGRTGKADIMIPEINRELECKLSTVSLHNEKCPQKGTLSFQLFFFVCCLTTHFH